MKGPPRRGESLRKGPELPDGLKPPRWKLSKAPRTCFLGRLGPSGSWRSSLCQLWQRRYPCLFQLLEQILKVNFLLHKDIVTFNDNGDPLSSYNCLGLEWPQLDLQGRRLLLLVSSLARHKYDQKPVAWKGQLGNGDMVTHQVIA